MFADDGELEGEQSTIEGGEWRINPGHQQTVKVVASTIASGESNHGHHSHSMSATRRAVSCLRRGVSCLRRGVSCLRRRFITRCSVVGGEESW